eukprot:c27075_g2_i1 orf=94-2274(+)
MSEEGQDRRRDIGARMALQVENVAHARSSGQSEFASDMRDNKVTLDEENILASCNRFPIRDGKEQSIEQFFANTAVPPWRDQITVRGVFLSAVLGSFFCIIVFKLSFTAGIIPSLNISAGLLGFFFIKGWTLLLAKLGIQSKPFTRQENTVIQTCVVASYGLAFSGGFGTYLLGMDRRSFETANTGNTYTADSDADIKNPRLGWIFSFMFAVSFLGLLAVVPIRKIMIIDYKLTYPSGTATAVLINSFHTPHGAEQAKKQIKCLGKYFAISLSWSFFKWFYSGGDNCGFDNFPSLGLKAFSNRFYFDFNLTYVGAGMICPHLINCSLLLGSIISWGLMWPLINNHSGSWYPSGLKTSDLRGLNGYKVFIAISLILGDGLYNFVKIMSIVISSNIKIRKKQLPICTEQNGNPEMLPDEQKRQILFMKDRIPFKISFALYVVLATISTVVIPKIFHQMRWYYVFLSYCIAPVLGFCNAYGMGLTDWNLASTYGKLGLFIFSAWAGRNGGVIVGLASCGVMMVIVSCAADLMQDFKTGYLTLSSPRSMFTSQVIGTAIGCVVAPLTFWLFWSAFPIGDPNGSYPAPYTVIYREMATIGVQGFSALPKHCLQLCYGFFAISIVVNFIRDWMTPDISQFIPIPMAMAIPFYLGPYFTIDMFLGTVIVFIWQKLNRKKSEIFIPAVASGLLCGDGVWTLPSAILALAKVQPPICMLFLSRKTAATLSLILKK